MIVIGTYEYVTTKLASNENSTHIWRLFIHIIDGAAKFDTESWHTQRPHLADFWNLLIWTYFVNGWKSNSFRGNYSFLDLEIQRSQYINVRKLFKGGNYSRVETIWGNTVFHFYWAFKQNPEQIWITILHKSYMAFH